ncbi:putative secreted protein (Por secretion system target) [Breznakibacter xylanolyticus]|uniref:Putative secreted protein (Por secretion system target) n=1 Tax=Breznakibacter xylanolyticus TaxID=990 RepID=A0A2W7NCX6_9BACT|nr:T9SS type A sorting domain-containing protein [Breznakibacter xylanolyticus]PZX17830.1 putative secreted protein (Por secretion system target) [Breznakibacter xylanolyticus]
MSGITLTDEKDYTNNEGIFTFLKIPNEKIYCEMTNATFPALSGTKALKTTFTDIGSTPPAAPLSLHPTPDGFRVSGIEQPADVTITDLTGRVVTTTTVDVGGEVPVGHLKQGNYLVKVNERVLKLIKK